MIWENVFEIATGVCLGVVVAYGLIVSFDTARYATQKRRNRL